MEIYNIVMGHITIELPVDAEAYLYYSIEGKNLGLSIRKMTIVSTIRYERTHLQSLLVQWIIAIAEKNIDALALQQRFCDRQQEYVWDVSVYEQDCKFSLGLADYHTLVDQVGGIRHDAPRT
jgi:hypothetical protein